MQGQNLTLKPFLYIRSCSSYSLHSLLTKLCCGDTVTSAALYVILEFAGEVEFDVLKVLLCH